MSANHCQAALLSPGTFLSCSLDRFPARLQIANIARMDMKNIIVMKRPPSADSDNLPNHWINVYQPLQDTNGSSLNMR